MKKKRPITNWATKYLEREGFSVTIVERKVTRTISQDAFGIGDFLAYNMNKSSRYYGIWLVQVTDSTNHSKRVKKALASEHLAAWIASGGRFVVLSFKDQTTPRWNELGIVGARTKNAGMLRICKYQSHGIG